MEHALLAVLLCVGAPSDLDAELERRLRPDPVYDVSPATAEAESEPSAAAQDLDALLASELQEKRDIAQYRESQPPMFVMPSVGLWLRPGLMEELQQAMAPLPEETQLPGVTAQPAAVPEPRSGGGQLLVQGQPLPTSLREDIEARAQAIPARVPSAMAGQARPPPRFQVIRPQEPTLPGEGARGSQSNVVPPEATVSFEGELEDVSTDRVWIRDAQGGLVELSIRPDTQVFQDGQLVEVLELREGSPVSASFELDQGAPVATSLIVMED